MGIVTVRAGPQLCGGVMHGFVYTLERLAVSPQCGFASVAGGNLLNEDEQAAKMRLVVEVAGGIWSVLR